MAGVNQSDFNDNEDAGNSWLLDSKQLDAFARFLRDAGGTTRLGKLVAPLHEPPIKWQNAARFIRAIKAGACKLPSDKIEMYAKATSHILGKDYDALYREIILLNPVAKSSPAQRPQKQISPEFCEFFGSSFCNDDNPVQLYFPKRVLKKRIEDGEDPPFEPERNCAFKYKGRKCTSVWTEGVGSYVTFESAMAAVELSTFFKDQTGANCWVRRETSSALSDGLNSCVISFGLGFSAFTRIAQKHFEPPLFTVYCAPSPKPTFNHKLTDHFTLGSKRIEVPEERDIALLARIIRIEKNSGNPQPWFICAGRTTTGTAAAAHFLMHNWQKMRALYKAQNKNPAADSMAVVVEHPELAPGQEIKLHGIDHPIESAKLHCWNDNKDTPCVTFSVWKEAI